MQNLKPIPTRERVATELRKAIFAGEYKPGDELLQAQIAQQLGVSRMPVREAVQLLSNEGLVELIPNRGAFVRTSVENLMRDYFHVRSLLECDAAALACKNITPDELKALQDLCEKEEQAVEHLNYNDADDYNEQIHRTIWRISGNNKLDAMLSQLWVGKPPLARPQKNEERVRASHQGHCDIINAIAAHDSKKAHELMQQHIVTALNDQWIEESRE